MFVFDRMSIIINVYSSSSMPIMDLNEGEYFISFIADIAALMIVCSMDVFVQPYTP